MKYSRTMAALTAGLLTIGLLAGCSTDAEVASRNLSKESEQFDVMRRIVFFNGITDTYLLEIDGYCSIAADTEDGQLEVTCKVGEDQYKKHFLGLSDNVSYFVEQTDPSSVSTDHYKVIFKPESIVPDIERP